MQCFRCGNELNESLFSHRIYYVCPRCRACMASAAALRNWAAAPDMLNRLWQASEFSSGEDGSLCRICGNKLRQIRLETAVNGKFEIDVCRSCQVFWFDEGELEKLPLREEQMQTPKHAPNKAIDMSKPMELPDDMPANESSDESFADFLCGVMGVPVYQDAKALSKVPWLTLTLIMLCTAALCLEGYYGFDVCTKEWGFIPAHPFRHGGATLLTSAFLHISFIHFASNIYFLWLSGKLIEQELSLKTAAVVFLLSLAASKTFYLITAPNMNIPCVGASGFISGFMGCCAVLYPAYKLSFLIRSVKWTSTPAWIELPFWFCFAVWFIIQTAMVFVGSDGQVAFTSHIGGSVAGILCGIVLQYHFRQNQEI